MSPEALAFLAPVSEEQARTAVICDVRWPKSSPKASRTRRQTRRGVRVQEEIMKTRTLGNSGIEASAPGYGGMGLKGV
jgi:hypothetical protein